MGIAESIINYLKIKEIRAQEEDADGYYVKGYYWPRLLSLMPGSQSGAQSPNPSCEDNEEEEQEIEITITAQEAQEEEEEEEVCEGEEAKRGRSRFARKLSCMYHGAKHGLKEGALSGVFFGGGWGIYKYLDGAYLNKENKEGGEEGEGGGSEENGSTVNDNVIFVTAANSAIAMGIFCTFFCCTKAAIYCY